MLVLPSCPSLLLPQHSTVPPVRTAHEWPQPALTWMAVAMPSTSTGVVLSPPSATLVFPSSPASLLPQHAIVPSFRRAHEWVKPPSTLVASTPLKCEMTTSAIARSGR